MKEKLITIALLLILIIIAETSLAQEIRTETTLVIDKHDTFLTVDKQGDTGYESIQKAINHASEGTMIYVKTGIYNETINIDKKIKLKGENKDDTIINPISDKNKYALRLGAPNIIIENLSITNRGPGIYTTGVEITTSNVEIHDCKIHDTPVGIAIWRSNNLIENCVFWGCKDEGIALIGSQILECNNNTIKNCIFYDNCDGIELQHSSDNTIENCEFYNNTHTGIDAIVSSNHRNKISNCEIYNNQVNGIYLYASSNNQIIDCSILDNNDGNVMISANSCNNKINSIDFKENIDNEIDEKQTIIEVINKTEEYHVKFDRKSIIKQVFNKFSNFKISRILTLFNFL